MKYVYVAGGGDGNNDEIEKAITQQTQYALYSLIHGLKQKNFGLHTVEGVTCDIREFSNRYIAPVDGKVVTDSGGYSFIKGDISPEKIPEMIDCYAVYTESERKIFDYIFSLDIPISLKYTEFNTVNNIFNANKKSLIETRELLDKYPELQNKFYFVWHFKIKEQFAIWKRLYAELEMGRFVRNHAIGGLVGLKKAAKIKFAPFIGISFYILSQYWSGFHASAPLRMHYLGVYSKGDRFVIAFIEKLFKAYLKDIAEVVATYDSINFVHTVRMNAQVPLYAFDGKNFDIYPSLLDAPQEILRTVAVNDTHVKLILAEADRRRNGIRLENAGAFSPLNVYSNIHLDKFFEMIIDKYAMVYELAQSSSPTNWDGRIDRIMEEVQRHYNGSISPHMQKSIKLSLAKIWYWHKWYVGKRDVPTLEEYMTKNIREINFPARLK
jgi:hypothetical protein